ncbi:protein SOSEKI 2-like isoform X1 [Zingiber officinale]|uniref:protein SOSEKI 2-like isoform X1 n=1 Tax=Zingiber officinale TaxID=94328 RepID=UPI001C4B9402|nr:protein SOSEKI 2-like isoform X1 [Zingiber officinale]
MQRYEDGGGRASRVHNSSQQQRLIRPARRVQVIYYLSRNGQLEHPHYIELPYLPSRQLRLRDVTERLTLLRGKAMLSHFSWSCKRYVVIDSSPFCSVSRVSLAMENLRGYKNGYVWNDLTEDDVIYPADGVEYVLKGSEIIPDSYEGFRRIPTGGRRQKPLPVSDKFHLELEEEEEEDEVLMVEEGKNTRNNGKCAASDNAGCCSRGVSTEGTERIGTRIEMPLDDSSPPPSTTSSDKPGGRNTSRRFEDTDHSSSLLLQLIACGSAALKRGKIAGSGSGASKSAPTAGSGGEQGAVSRRVSRATVAEVEQLRRVPENPQIRHHLVDDKEYFSGSIVEGSKYYLQPSLKKSSSCHEERSCSTYSGIGEGRSELEKENGGGDGARGKCIPGRRKSSAKQQ